MVYVGTRIYPYGRMKMSHMAADSLEELHDMADKIGINRKWFQNKPSRPHYDISQTKKTLAIKFGAKEISDKEMITIFNKHYS